MISYRFVSISSQKGVLFLKHPVLLLKKTYVRRCITFKGAKVTQVALRQLLTSNKETFRKNGTD